MKIDYSDYIKHFCLKLIDNNAKLEKYIECKHLSFDFIDFVSYLEFYDVESIPLLKETIVRYYHQFECSSLPTSEPDFYMQALSDLGYSLIIKIIFSNSKIESNLKSYLKHNAIRTFINTPSFMFGIKKSISENIKGVSGIIFYDTTNPQSNPTLCLNPPLKNGCNTINEHFLSDAINYLVSKNSLLDTLLIEINENKISLTIDSDCYNGILVKDKDIDLVLNSYVFKGLSEKSMIVDAFFNKEVPYELVILYMSSLSKYIDMSTDTVIDNVEEAYAHLLSDSYYRYLRYKYSKVFAVFIHSICPKGKSFSVLNKSNLKHENVSPDYANFSFLVWFINKYNFQEL